MSFKLLQANRKVAALVLAIVSTLAPFTAESASALPEYKPDPCTDLGFCKPIDNDIDPRFDGDEPDSKPGSELEELDKELDRYGYPAVDHPEFDGSDDPSNLNGLKLQVEKRMEDIVRDECQGTLADCNRFCRIPMRRVAIPATNKARQLVNTHRNIVIRLQRARTPTAAMYKQYADSRKKMDEHASVLRGVQAGKLDDACKKVNPIRQPKPPRPRPTPRPRPPRVR